MHWWWIYTIAHLFCSEFHLWGYPSYKYFYTWLNPRFPKGGGAGLPPLGFFFPAVTVFWLTFLTHKQPWQLLFWCNTKYGKLWKNGIWTIFEKISMVGQIFPPPRVLCNSGSQGQLGLIAEFDYFRQCPKVINKFQGSKKNCRTKRSEGENTKKSAYLSYIRNLYFPLPLFWGVIVLVYQVYSVHCTAVNSLHAYIEYNMNFYRLYHTCLYSASSVKWEHCRTVSWSLNWLHTTIPPGWGMTNSENTNPK